ncbi:2'-5' RNA ligase family protein [Nocardia sp. NPDC050710]|uniref:2'-5' RNA ligase family protein n=1 Tax=Nocardia sp. NPDC050710 TaxID=3157220 RepID=UPI0033E1F2CD
MTQEGHTYCKRVPAHHDSETADRTAQSVPFPPSLPDSLSDPELINRNDWESFNQIAQLENHWERGPWPADRRTYFWYLTFRDVALTELAAQCQSQLDSENLDLVPLDGLHITVLRIGNQDEVENSQILAVVNNAKSLLRNFQPFEISVGPLSGSRGAIRFSISPWDGLFELHRVVHKAVSKSVPELDMPDTERFRPHLGIGYSNRIQPSDRLIKKVDTLRDLAPVSVCVDNVKLVTLRREFGTYRWDEIATLKLGSD